MSILDEAVAAARVDPRQLHAMLAAGQPEHTVALARAFEEAGRLALESQQRSHRAHATIGDSLTNNAAPVLDVATHDDQAWRALGQGGRDLEDTAAHLRRSVVALEDAQATATAAISRMTADLNAIGAATNRAIAQGTDAVYLPQAVTVVSTAAATIQRAIDDYDRGLLRDAADLAARGHTPGPNPSAIFLNPEQRAAIGELLTDAGAEFGSDLTDAGAGIWDLLPVRAIWEPQDYADDLARYAGSAADSAAALADDPAGTLLAAGKDLIAYDHWVNGEPGRAVGHIAAEVLLAGAAGRLLKVLREGAPTPSERLLRHEAERRRSAHDAVLNPDGSAPGTAGSSPDRREVDRQEFSRINNSLRDRLGPPDEVREIPGKGRIEIWNISPDERVVYRGFSTSGARGLASPQTIDIHRVKGLEGVSRIHVID